MVKAGSIDCRSERGDGALGTFSFAAAGWRGLRWTNLVDARIKR
ncbi:hypothetical protein RMSM_07062 [Rhodopirellula maiorica SM1]|uniref:Uncharacterized protein n=1 Tax=Rhodopirellula maiorica SM1 TaxID=1265738 RepID=M5RKW8_9BACT|nr:hypothetical protein RMSM_07062 [Rhodopirellula maiorica SM1]